MRIKYRFGFNTDKKTITRFLDKNSIKYDKDEIVTVFDIFEDDEKFSLLNSFMKSHNINPILDAVYTREEIESAKWLTIRSCWWSQYPQPEKDWKYIHTTYDSTNYCEGNEPAYFCRKGLIQKEPFIIKKEPNWGPRNFMMLNWIGDELFISKKTEKVLKASNLKGFEIYDVLSKSKKPFEGIKQIFVKNYLAEGICANSIERKYICPKCSFVKYLKKTGYNCFHKEIFEGVQDDIVKTTDKFGDVDSESMILVTHRFYEVVTNAKLDKGLVFEPVELI